jgi:hypothetical protein
VLGLISAGTPVILTGFSLFAPVPKRKYRDRFLPNFFEFISHPTIQYNAV